MLSLCIYSSLAWDGSVTYRASWSKTNQSSSAAYQGLQSLLCYNHTPANLSKERKQGKPLGKKTNHKETTPAPYILPETDHF